MTDVESSLNLMHPLSSTKLSWRWQDPFVLMAKFKPKTILSRVLLGKSRQKQDDLDYLCTGLQRYLFLGLDSEAYIGRAMDNHEDNDDDRSSICSFSTTATVDNLPGAGRTVDTYIYQPAGRWIERLAMRFTIASLHPARIAQYLEEDDTRFHPVFDESINLHDAIANIYWGRRVNGSTIVAGMKGLVKQTQSNSINRAACALAALIRVSLVRMRTEIYANVSRIEPIFHLETLVRSYSDKKWFFLLVKLARETLIAIRAPLVQKSFDSVLGTETLQLRPSLECAQKLRQRLIRALEIYRLSGHDSLEDTIGQSCAICAEAVSTCIDGYSQGDAYMHVLETVYFTVIFLLRSIQELVGSASITANGHIYMVLQTIACWIDAIVYQCIYHISTDSHRFDMDLLKANISLRSLIVDGNRKHILLPRSFEYISDRPVVDKRTLPRRHRGEGTPPIQSLFEAANHRTLRLLGLFDELEREVWGCASRSNSQSEIDADPHWIFPLDFGDEWWDYWRSTLKRARRVQVPDTTLTGEFREARRRGLDDKTNNYDRDWAHYQLRRISRHKWAQYLRSTMDWDWDLATCLKRLVKVQKQMRGRLSRTQPASSSAIDVAAGPGGTLEISMGDAQEESLPTAVRFAYRTKAGETRYMSFVPAGSGPGCQPHSEIASTGPSEEQILSPMVAQQVSEHRKGSFGGVQEVEDETSAFPSDVSQHDTHLVEEPNDGCEWKEPVYNAGYDGFWAREDTISVCSLD